MVVEREIRSEHCHWISQLLEVWLTWRRQDKTKLGMKIRWTLKTLYLGFDTRTKGAVVSILPTAQPIPIHRRYPLTAPPAHSSFMYLHHHGQIQVSQLYPTRSRGQGRESRICIFSHHSSLDGYLVQAALHRPVQRADSLPVYHFGIFQESTSLFECQLEE